MSPPKEVRKANDGAAVETCRNVQTIKMTVTTARRGKVLVKRCLLLSRSPKTSIKWLTPDKEIVSKEEPMESRVSQSKLLVLLAMYNCRIS